HNGKIIPQRRSEGRWRIENRGWRIAIIPCERNVGAILDSLSSVLYEVSQRGHGPGRLDADGEKLLFGRSCQGKRRKLALGSPVAVERALVRHSKRRLVGLAA